MVSANPTPPSGVYQIRDDQLLPPYAIDGNEGTRYSTAEAANGDEWFQIDLSCAVPISGATTFTATSSDVAASYSIQVSLDGTNWTTVLTSPTPAEPRMTLTFAPVTGRYVRYNQTGIMTTWWSLHEIGIACSG
jgi:hypothetical protein